MLGDACGPGSSCAVANGGGIDDDGSLQLTSSAVDDNVATASNSGDGALALDGGIGDDGSLWLTSSSVDHNHVSVTVPDASGFTAVGVGGGLGVTGTAVVRSSRIDANDIVAAATNGTVEAGGGGMANLSGALTVEQTLVAGNHTTASGAGGDVLGGGILNIAFGGPDPQLTLTSSAVLANTLTSSGVPSLGGGIFTSDPPTIVSTVIAGNVPDQCAGDC